MEAFEFGFYSSLPYDYEIFQKYSGNKESPNSGVT
jgi:hypothetical protein